MPAAKGAVKQSQLLADALENYVLLALHKTMTYGWPPGGCQAHYSSHDCGCHPRECSPIHQPVQPAEQSRLGEAVPDYSQGCKLQVRIMQLSKCRGIACSHATLDCRVVAVQEAFICCASHLCCASLP